MLTFCLLLHVLITLRILPTCRMFNRGQVNMEKVLYCFYKVILKNSHEFKMSQVSLHTLILTHLLTNESAPSSTVIFLFFIYDNCELSLVKKETKKQAFNNEKNFNINLQTRIV